jgi:hypothetical protein
MNKENICLIAKCITVAIVITLSGKTLKEIKNG